MEEAQEGMMEGLCLDNAVYFIYTGQEDVPDNVIHIRIHTSIGVIRVRAFFQRERLISVEFHNGVKVIKEKAFKHCRSLCEILIPPSSVTTIKKRAFACCSWLTTVIILGDGIKVIEEWAFHWCTSLCEILIPPSIRVIKEGAVFARG